MMGVAGYELSSLFGGVTFAAEVGFPQIELSAKDVVPGTVSLLTVQTKESSVVTGKFEAIDLPFFELSEGVSESHLYGAVLAVPYEHPVGLAQVQITIQNTGSKAQAEKIDVPVHVIRGKYPSEKLKVDSSRVSPKGAKILAQIHAEQQEVGTLYDRITLKKYWGDGFVLPIASTVTSQFGTRRIFNGSLKNFHPGVDLRAQTPTEVHAAAGGIVVMAKPLFYTGNTVMIDHGYGIITLYAHLSQIDVKVDQEIQSGQVVGLSGKTGRVSGPHLHWQAVVHHTKVNPLGLLQLFAAQKPQLEKAARTKGLQ